MTLMIILICLIAERFLLEKVHLRNNRWLLRYSEWLQHQKPPAWLERGVVDITLLLLPALLAIGIFQHIFDEDLLEISLSIVILLYCLGPEDLDTQISQYTEAVDDGDEANTNAIASTIIMDEPPISEPARSQAVAEGVLLQANQNLFAVLFWFIVLGPLGAMIYRLTTWLPTLVQSNRDIDFHLNSKQLAVILDWIPARITAFCYAIAGSFEDALYGWRSFQKGRFSEFNDSNSGTLICTGSGAMRLSTLLDEANEGNQLYSTLPRSAMDLVWRSLVVFLVILTLLSMIGII
ncbi:MAG: regulatory signaling modulator protein AmpE [Candidatus Thiodiazotropha sp. (ex Lucinoma aequizonata)]|nr:regulatory signaling modulator protein AmpE [Candidatus Thiodiazotropha sp. (ex Lucinoma aequizonata)]